MKAHLASMIAWLAAAASSVVGDAASHGTVLLQRALVHTGPATVDVSADGRFVAFESSAALVPEDRNRGVDIYVLDRASASVTLESVAVNGATANGSMHPRLSGDGRYLVFSTVVVDSTYAVVPQVVMRDRHTGTTTLVSRTLAGTPASRSSGCPDISHDGRIVVFQSAATDLVPMADRNGWGSDVYVFDARSQTIGRVSVNDMGEQPTKGSSFAPAVSGDSRHVVFVSSAPLDGTPGLGQSAELERPRQVYLRDLAKGQTRRISRAPDGNEPDGPSFHPAVSGDGRIVAFASEAANLEPRDRNRAADIFLHDTHTGETTLVSRSARRGSASGSSRHPALSVDGRFVAFVSEAADLVCAARCPPHLADLNLVADVYLYDALTRGVVRASGAGGAAGSWWEMSVGPALDATGRLIAFSSLHAIDASDVAHDFDLFLQMRPQLLEPAGTSDAMRRR